MKILLVIVGLFFWTLSFTQEAPRLGRTGPSFGESYEKCAQWKEPSTRYDASGAEMPSVCIRWQTCKEEIAPGEPALVSCECYLGLTQSHPDWCADCAYPSVTAIGTGDSKEMAEKEARAVCDLKFREVMGNKAPGHYDFKVNNCRQKGQEVCE